MSLRRHPKIELLSSRRIFSGRIFDVIEESLRLPSGLRQDLAIVDHPGAVAIAALDEQGDLVLVRQYRHACGDWMLEIPAGRREPGEDSLSAAQRELEEETGHRAARWDLLREFHPAPGFCSELIALYLARDLELQDGGGKPADDDEEIELVRMSPAAVLASAIHDGKTLLAAALVQGLSAPARDR